MARLLSVLLILFWGAACNRQHKTQPVSATATAQAPAPQADPTPAPPAAENPVVTGEPADAPVHLTIPAGTRIRVRLGRTLDTRRSHRGEQFAAYLDSPIISGDRVVMPKGTAFEGHVIEARSSGRLKGRAYLGITLDSFRLNGTDYAITTTADIQVSRSHKKRNLAIIGGGSGGGAAIGAIAGGGVGALIGAGAGAAAGTTGAFLTGRKNVTLPVETPMSFSLHRAVTLPG